MENKVRITEKSVAGIVGEQTAFFLICLLAGYIFASLRKWNEVDYGDIGGRLPDIVVPAVICAVLLYAGITLILRTKARSWIRNLFRVFEVSSGADAVHMICGTFVFFALYMLIIKFPCDYPSHTHLAVNVFDWRSLGESILDQPYPVWHIMVNLLYKVFHIPYDYAAALTSASLYTMEYCVIRKIIMQLNREVLERRQWMVDVFSALLMFSQPVYVPWFNQEQYIGQGSHNVWHNPTITACYPFALICTYLFVKMIREDSGDIHMVDYVRFGFFLLLSVLAKPCFIQVFLPAAAVALLVLLFRTNGKSLLFTIKFACGCIPACLWCVLILFLSFVFQDTADNNGIGFGFFDVWRLYTPNVAVSLLLALLFPLAYLVLQNRNIKNKLSMSFAWLCLLSGVLEYGLLKETGSRFSDGNFSWGYSISLTILYVFTASDFFGSLADRKRKAAVCIPVIVITLQVLFGVRYYLELFLQHIIL